MARSGILVKSDLRELFEPKPWRKRFIGLKIAPMDGRARAVDRDEAVCGRTKADEVERMEGGGSTPVLAALGRCQ